tara:strand:+ start:3868 stop:4095 length:228 start_codon:yes stop_codon:yes gene_type:complete
MNLMKDTIKEAIDIFSQETAVSQPRVNLSQDVTRESLAEFIDKYILDKLQSDFCSFYPLSGSVDEDCCGNDCGCH